MLGRCGKDMNEVKKNMLRKNNNKNKL